MWAGSGIAAQQFFAVSDRNAMELTNIRMVVSGLLLFVLSYLLGGMEKSFAVIERMPTIVISIGIYSVVGILLMQFSYFAGIAAGNAAAATVIQYTCPAMVICFDAFKFRRWPKKSEVAAVVLAMGGIFLLVTGGNAEKLSVPLLCLLWSLASGAFFAFSSIYPRKLIAKLDKYFLLSLGMLIGGVVSFLLVEDLDWRPFFAADAWFYVAFIILFGTVGAFLLFNVGLKYLTPEEATVTATIEPAASVVLSFFLFGTLFGAVETLGIIMVIAAIILPLLRRGNR